jgi:hypothetical protein
MIGLPLREIAPLAPPMRGATAELAAVGDAERLTHQIHRGLGLFHVDPGSQVVKWRVEEDDLLMAAHWQLAMSRVALWRFTAHAGLAVARGVPASPEPDWKVSPGAATEHWTKSRDLLRTGRLP